MISAFPACRVFEPDSPARFVHMTVDDLSPGDVLVRVEWSGVNYKDALSITGRGRIARRTPVNAGSDAAGTVIESGDARFPPGTPVLLGGMTLGEEHDGGFAGFVRVPGTWVVPMPDGLSGRQAMALGTAGFSAALALHRLETNGQTADMGPVVVTGASGAVGSYAVALLAGRGFRVLAVSSRPAHADYLHALGAADVTTPAELALGPRPLESGRFGGAIDNIGGEMLGALVRHIRPRGAVVSVGNAAGTDVRTSVYPFILRGVSVLGLSATHCPMNLRRALWARLAGDIRPEVTDLVGGRTVGLSDVLSAAEDVLERRVRGRIVVDCRTPAP